MLAKVALSLIEERLVLFQSPGSLSVAQISGLLIRVLRFPSLSIRDDWLENTESTPLWEIERLTIGFCAWEFGGRKADARSFMLRWRSRPWRLDSCVGAWFQRGIGAETSEVDEVESGEIREEIEWRPAPRSCEIDHGLGNLSVLEVDLNSVIATTPHHFHLPL